MTTQAQEFTKYNKRIEDIIEDAEIEAELEAESRIRSKNTKVLLISCIGLISLFFIYLGINSDPVKEPKPDVEKAKISKDDYIPEPKPIPFEVDQDSPKNNVFENMETASEVSQIDLKLPKRRKVNVSKSKPIPTPPEKTSINASPAQSLMKELTTNLKNTSLIKTISVTKNDTSKTKTVVKKKIASEKRFSSTNKFFIQVGAFSVKNNADLLAKKLKTKGLPSIVWSRGGSKDSYKVFTGSFPKKSGDPGLLKDLKAAGFFPKLESYEKGQFSYTIENFSSKKEADKLQDQLSMKGFLSSISQKKGKRPTYIVGVGNYNTQSQAKPIQKQMQALGFKNIFIKKLS